MTANQWRLLDILEDYSGLGTIEVEIQWGDYDFDDGKERATPDQLTKAEVKGMMVCRLVVAGLMRTLVKKGFATTDDGYSITEAGRAILERRRQRLVKAKGA